MDGVGQALAVQPELEDDSELPWYLREASECATALLDKRTEYFNAMRTSGIVGMWQQNWSSYYGTDSAVPGQFASPKLSRVGDEREYTKVKINDFRSFLRQQIQTALGPKPAFKSTTRTTDVKTLAAIPTLDRGIQHIMDKTWTQSKRRRVLERMVVMGGGYVHVRWDKEAGDRTKETIPVKDEKTGETMQKPMVDQESGQPVVGAMGIPVTEDVTKEVDVKTGMPTQDIGSMWECYYDPLDEEQLPWIVATEPRSKWELAKLFEDHADDLRSLEGGNDEYSRERLFGANVFGNMSGNEDRVLLHHFYLRPTADAPDGRYMGFVEGCDPLWDRPLPAELDGELPVVMFLPAPYIGANVGYSDASDLVPIQGGIDNVTSDWMSNARAFGRAWLANPKGSGINLEGARKGLNVLDYGGDKVPSYVMPPKFDNAIDLLNYMHRRMESVSQQNAVRRGDPQANIKSGTMAALFNQQSVDFVSDYQQTFDDGERKVANISLKLAQTRAKGEFLIKVTGSGSRPYWESFAAQGLKGIEDIEVETISSMMRSPAGRFEYWQQIQMVPPDKQAAVRRGLETGDWSGLDDEDSSEDMRLIAETELLLQGKRTVVSVIDDPIKHMKQHKADLMKLEAADPTIIGPPPTDPMTGQPAVDPMTGEPVPGQPIPGKYDAQKRAITEHMLEHTKIWQMNSDPRTNALLGMPSPPPMPGTPTGDLAMMMGGAPGMGMQPGADQQGGGAPQQPPPDAMGGDPNQAGGQPKQPQPAQPPEAPQ